jgi:hypothetical protein
MSDLAEKLVVKRKNLVYLLVYKLMKLALILHVATISVERVFFCCEHNYNLFKELNKR